MGHGVKAKSVIKLLGSCSKDETFVSFAGDKVAEVLSEGL